MDLSFQKLFNSRCTWLERDDRFVFWEEASDTLVDEPQVEVENDTAVGSGKREVDLDRFVVRQLVSINPPRASLKIMAPETTDTHPNGFRSKRT